MITDTDLVFQGRKKSKIKGLHPDRFKSLPYFAALLFRFYHRTCQFTIVGKEYEQEALNSGGPILLTAWHFAFPAVIYHNRDRNGLLMVSRSRDGEWAARVLSHLGYRCFRGSPGKGGSIALKQLINHIHDGVAGGFIADGSQGPPRIAQKGILVLARYTQAPLIPVSMAANPCFRFPSWDKTVLAKPFARVVLAYGAPIRVPREASADEMEKLRLHLEESLNSLTEYCERKVSA